MMKVEAIVPNGGTHGSPVSPLLRRSVGSATAGLPPGKARLRPRGRTYRTNGKGGSR
jgi:hypothetical protein